MNRKLISFAVAAAMFCSQAANTVSVFAADTAQAVYSCDFSKEGDIVEYSLYDDTNTEGSPTYDAQLQRLTASFGSSHSWNDKNGIKTDITKSLEGCVTGDKIKASLDFTSTYWSDPIGKARLFLEVVNASGTKQITIYEGPESVSANDETVTISGETAEYSYTAGDKVYLCVTQGSGMHYYDNIAVFVEKGQSAEKTVVNDNFESGYAEGYTAYDESDTAAVVNFYDGILGIGFTGSWSESNGIKKDITSLATNGETYSVSIDMNGYWGETADGAAKLFFEIVEAGGEKRRIALGEALGEGENAATINGTAELEFAEGDKVYVCVTQPSGYHTYDNLLVKTVSAVPTATAAATAPAATATATAAATVPAATATAAADGTVLSDDFADGDVSGYVVYDSANTGAQAAVNEDGTLGVNFGAAPYDWNESNGVKKDITELVESGSRYDISADVYSSWWGGVNAKLFFEIMSGDTTTRVDIAEDMLEIEGDGSVSLKGEANLTFNEGDKVYLCITQAAGYQTYDNIVVKYVGKAQPSETIPPEVTDVPDDGTVINDDFAKNGYTAGYTVYDSANTGAELSAEGVLGVNFGTAPYDWNENNGVKKDITELVESGSKYEASADVYSSWWGGVNAKLFFEIESGGTKTRVPIAEDGNAEGDGSMSLSGKADLWFENGDKVYICITQAAGYQTYDNIVVKYTGEAGPKPQETDAPPAGSASPVPTLEPIENAIFNDDFSSADQAESYAIYDSNNTTAGVGISIDNGELVASMGAEGWNASNGIRRDITELVKQYISGVTFGVQLGMTAFWGENNDTPATVFFETVGENGTSTVTEIGTMVPTDGSETATMRGSAQLSYTDGDRIYLCVTQMSGNHRYDNIAMWLENENGEGIIPLTSGMSYTGTYFPESADAIFKHTFSGNAAAEMEQYSAYNEVAYVTAEPRDGGAFFEFPEGGTSTRGVVVDITEAIENNIPNGGQVRISCKMLPWWWWGSASIKVRTGGTISDVAIYTANTGDPGGVWATIGEVIDLAHTPGEKVELIITMDSSSATGITIDDVCVELPYKDVTARDIAVSDVSKLADVSKVSIVYGGKFVTEADVDWGDPDPGADVVYGTTSITGVMARAVITDSAVKVKVTPDGVSTEDIKLEYGKAVTASGDNEMVFLLDSMDRMNLISAVSGTGIYSEPEKGTPETSAKMAVRDNGNGVTIEGIAAEAADNNKIIIIKNANGELVEAVHVQLGSDGGYSAAVGTLPTGTYTAVMTDTGISAPFSYATASEFEELRDKINNGSAAALLEDDTNRMILGASTYEQLDKLSSGDKNKVYSEFKAELGNKTRAEAAELFDALVTINAAADEVSESEWTEMLEMSANALGIKNLPIYEQYKAMDEDDRKSAKEKTYSLGAGNADEFVTAFSGAVLNTRLVNAGQYTNVQNILKENADLFDGTDVSSISINEAKYIISHISERDITIDAIAALIEEAEENAESTGNTGSGGSGGGGGGGGGAAGGSSTVPGSSIGLNINTETGQIGTSVGSDENGNETSSVTFSDLSGYDWAETAVYHLAGIQVINGYGDGTFRPGESVTREAFVKMLVSALDIPMGGSGSSFSDVPADRWSYSYVSAAAAAGIVTGVSDTEFAPEANITRQDAAVMLYRALQYKGNTLSVGELTFTDGSSIAEYARDAVSALSAVGVINGMDDGSFAPDGITSRAQAAVMIYRVVDTLI